MPYQHLDDDARRIVQRAEQLARDEGSEFVGTEHFLMAIVGDGTCTGARVLHGYQIDAERVNRTLSDVMKAQKEGTWVPGRLPGSPHLHNVMELAIDEATQMESSKIGSEHLLLALLREPESTARRILTKLGIKLADCRERVLKLLSA